MKKKEDITSVDKALYTKKYHWLLSEGVEEVSAYDFYRDIFPVGTFQSKGDHVKEGTRKNLKGNGILLQITSKGGEHRVVTDDLEEILKYQGKKDVIMSPISYFGKRRTTRNASFIHALAFDLDGQNMREIKNTLHQLRTEVPSIGNGFTYLPTATYLVLSGHGVHLYYVLKSPLPMKPYFRRELGKLKEGLTEIIWNERVSTQWKTPQHQPITQGFRVVGSASKLGSKYPVRAFKIGSKWDLNDLNEYIPDLKETIVYRGNFNFVDVTPIKQAKELWPDWYQRKVVEGRPSKKWTVKRDLYDWWLRTIKKQRKLGHRYFCVMCLAMYAVKCGISFKELQKDAYGLIKDFDKDSTPENRFTKKDVDAAIAAYKNGAENFTRNYISRLTAIEIKENKRNYRTQVEHIKVMNAIREIVNPNWRDGNGRPKGRKNSRYPKAEIIKQWRDKHPSGKKIDCHRDTGITRPTIDKYWDC